MQNYSTTTTTTAAGSMAPDPCPYDPESSISIATWYIRVMRWLSIPTVGRQPLWKWNIHALPRLMPDELVAGWRYRNAAIAIVTGARSQLVVGDCDPRHGGRLETFWERGWPRDTVIARTAGKPSGWHVYCRCGPDGLPSDPKYGPGLEVKANGALVIAPRSKHAKTVRRYEWVPGHEPWAIPLATVPDAVAADLLAHTPHPRVRQAIADADAGTLPTLAYTPEETVELATRLLNWAIDQTRADQAYREHRNNMAYRLGLQLGSLGLADQEVAAVAALYEQAVRHD